METPIHCTVSTRPHSLNLLWLGLLALAVLGVHGFHPWAEDGGLYVAGIEYLLQPTLFPKETAFVTEHLRFSAFAPCMAAVVRWTHLSLAAVLLGAYLVSAFLTLAAGLRLAALLFHSRRAQWSAVGMLAAWWTMPVAGTSLLLMDPYVTARSFSTPFCLMAITHALRWRSPRRSPANRRAQQAITGSAQPLSLCFLWLILTAAVHPLMAFYAFALIAVLLWERWSGTRSLLLPLCGAFLVAGAVQAFSRPESTAVLAAASSRYYWFLSRWQWYEQLGLLLPLLILSGIVWKRPSALTREAIRLCRAAVFQALGALAIAVRFAREGLHAHPIARLQPLRAFSLVYLLMALLLGGLLAEALRRCADLLRGFVPARLGPFLPALPIVVVAGIMYRVQRAEFPLSPHLELPGRVNKNPWVQAFLWSRDYTATDALFALDARYVNTEGEDAQTFRAIARRSAIPDYSKDGGEAAITSELAARWQLSAAATRHLSQLSDEQRDRQLRPFQVQWMVVDTNTMTAHPCPYRNGTVKVCRLD